MTSSESALSDLAARLAGTDASLSTSLRDILDRGVAGVDRGRADRGDRRRPG